VEAVLKTFAGIPYDWVLPRLSNGSSRKQLKPLAAII
jgi:hypothetical protein